MKLQQILLQLQKVWDDEATMEGGAHTVARVAADGLESVPGRVSLDDAPDDIDLAPGFRRVDTALHAARCLAECAECAALLEEVQLIRDRASALLRDAAPMPVSAPPFGCQRTSITLNASL